jgi:hypothetical protein
MFRTKPIDNVGSIIVSPERRHPRRAPSCVAIADANQWAKSCPNVDGYDLSRCCWACGYADAGSNWKPERAHVLAHSSGGTSDPNNFFLLCYICHKEQPDGLPRANQEYWLRTRESHFDRSARLYSKPIEAIVTEILNAGISLDTLQAYFQDEFKNDLNRVSATSSMGRFSTFAGVLRGHFLEVQNDSQS